MLDRSNIDRYIYVFNVDTMSNNIQLFDIKINVNWTCVYSHAKTQMITDTCVVVCLFRLCETTKVNGLHVCKRCSQTPMKIWN